MSKEGGCLPPSFLFTLDYYIIMILFINEYGIYVALCKRYHNLCKEVIY